MLVFCLLYLSIKWEYYRDRMTESAAYWNQLNPNKPTISDNLLILLGAFVQQGKEIIFDNIIVNLNIINLSVNARVSEYLF